MGLKRLVVKDEKKEIIKDDFKFVNLRILMGYGVIYKGGEIRGRSVFCFIYFILMRVYGFEVIGTLYL